MSLYTGKKIHCYEWMELPIDDNVIDQVHQLASAENQPDLVGRMPLFEWSIGVPIDDSFPDDDTSIDTNTDANPAQILPPAPQNDVNHHHFDIADLDPVITDDDASTASFADDSSADSSLPAEPPILVDNIDPAANDPAPDVIPDDDDRSFQHAEAQLL
jgi:hypothetical protein